MLYSGIIARQERGAARHRGGAARHRGARRVSGSTTCAVVMLLLVAMSPAQAQPSQSKAGIGSSSLRLATLLSVPVRLSARQTSAPNIVERSVDHLIVEIPVETAANLPWSLAVGTSSDWAPSGSVEVLDVLGRWAPLERDAADVTVVSKGAPTNPRARSIRLRLSDEADAEKLGSLRLSLRPAG